MVKIDARKLASELRSKAEQASVELFKAPASAVAANAALGAAMMVFGGLANAIEAAITESTDASN